MSQCILCQDMHVIPGTHFKNPNVEAGILYHISKE